jgi:Uma2 family endonuclease
MLRDNLGVVSKPPKATFDDIRQLATERRLEIIEGDIVEKASPSFDHCDVQLALGAVIRSNFGGRGGGARSTGWWLGTEVDIQLEPHNVFRPDISGWRRDRHATRPDGWPTKSRPDWVCEVLSPTNAENDLIKKFRVYHRAGIEHYWIVDPEHRSLIVYRNEASGYLAVLTALRGETVRAEPFDAIEIVVDDIFDFDD